MVFRVYISISVVFSQVLFHFGLRYGQVYIDHYANSPRTAISGLTASKDANDIVPTDRGAYFINDISLVKPYPNEKFYFYSQAHFTFTIACWIMTTGSEEGRIYSRVKNGEEYFYISHTPATGVINFAMANSSYSYFNSSDEQTFKNCKIHLVEWNLLFLSINYLQVDLYINTGLRISATLETNYFEDSS